MGGGCALWEESMGSRGMIQKPRAWWEHLDLIGDLAYLCVLGLSVLGVAVAVYRLCVTWRQG